jgi:hypothetical protein
MSRSPQQIRDALLDVLGDDAFGSIYEHSGHRVAGGAQRGPRGRRVEHVERSERPSSSPKQAEKNTQTKKKRRRTSLSDGIASDTSDEEWIAEKDADTAKNVVKARRRLLVSKAPVAGKTDAADAGLAAQAARAGTTAGTAAGTAAGTTAGTAAGTAAGTTAHEDPHSASLLPDGMADGTDIDTGPESSSPSSSPAPRKKPAKRKNTTKRSKTRREASGVLINGTMVHSITGVPDEFLLDMASLPPSKRPKKCGQCGSCLNPVRKKACEVMRALGTNPPIPRGKNREKLLGSANSKKHVPRYFGSTNAEMQDVTTLKHRGADDEFTQEELQRLQQALVETHPNINGYWSKVASKVGTKDEQACFQRVYQGEAYYQGRTKPKNAGGSGEKGGQEGDVGDVEDDGFIERVLQQRQIGFGGDGVQTRRASGGGERGSRKGRASVDHEQVRNLLENELAGLDDEETEDSEEF